jgi:hypothetical protein
VWIALSWLHRLSHFLLSRSLPSLSVSPFSWNPSRSYCHYHRPPPMCPHWPKMVQPHRLPHPIQGIAPSIADGEHPSLASSPVPRTPSPASSPIPLLERPRATWWDRLEHIEVHGHMESSGPPQGTWPFESELVISGGNDSKIVPETEV